jgi:hypothetical protein
MVSSEGLGMILQTQISFLNNLKFNDISDKHWRINIEPTVYS